MESRATIASFLLVGAGNRSEISVGIGDRQFEAIQQLENDAYIELITQICNVNGYNETYRSGKDQGCPCHRGSSMDRICRHSTYPVHAASAISEMKAAEISSMPINDDKVARLRKFVAMIWPP
eukprot:symbB.v1.2.041158.t1/scaffold7880.1/size8888/1